MTTPPTDYDGLGERVGRSLRQRPWIWLALTLVAMLVAWSAGATAFSDSREQAWADSLAVGLVAYCLVAMLVLLPLVVVPRSRENFTDNRLALIRWSLGTAAFLVGFASLALGGHAWSVSIAFVSSTLMLSYTAATARS